MTLYIDISSPEKGRGVFAGKDFKAGDIIEICPVYVIPKVDYDHFEKTQFTNYLFAWEKDDEGYAVCFGYGSIYNHSHEPNVEFEPNLEDKTMVFTALKDIKKGEELLSDYNWDDDAELEEWFIEYKKKYKDHYEKKSLEAIQEKEEARKAKEMGTVKPSND